MSETETLRQKLREHRIKEGIDYAILRRGDVYRVLCCSVWEELIWQEAKALGMKVEFYMFGMSRQ